jgi:hypothetical protein
MNAAAPEPARNRDVARAIGAALGRPSVLPVPSVAIRVMLGEFASDVLASQRVVPRKAQELGYRFRYPGLERAVGELVGG